MTNPTPHRATPEQWAEQELWASAEWDLSDSCCIVELRDRLAAAEQRISELEGNSSTGLTGSAPAIKPPGLTAEDALNLWSPEKPESPVDCARRIYRAGWDAAMAAQNLRQQDEDAERAWKPADPRISLVSTVDQAMFDARNETTNEAACAVIDAVAYWLESQNVGAGRACARWLREEVKRNG